MKTSLEQLNKWLTRKESVALEFKEAKNGFDSKRDLPDYCAALANEGGGKLILGVDDKGKVVGTKAFHGTANKLSHELFTKIKIRVDVEELTHPQGRILIFHVHGRPTGCRIRSTGKYLYPMRMGESLVEMDDIRTRAILNEAQSDFSSQIIADFKIEDVDDEAVENFKQRWAEKAQRQDYLNFSKEKVVRAVGVLSERGLSYAGLILFAKKAKLDGLLPCSEIIFEWRQEEKKTAHDFRKNWREPFFKMYEEVWNAINVRNLRFPFQEGLFQREVFAFNEKAIREALLNAVAHRDYTVNSSSIFIKASPQEFCVESPGGFPSGITPENILEKTWWRNRGIVEVFEKAGLVERAGQGMNDIFESTIREGKGIPSFLGSDEYSVVLRIPAQVKDKNFILFLEKIAQEKQIVLPFEEIFELERIREEQIVTKPEFKKKFLDLGIIVRVGKTKGAKYGLSHKYYIYQGSLGTYTRITGLSREQRKELILNHLRKNQKGFMKDFRDAFQDMRQSNINNLLQEMKKAGKVDHVGSKRSGYWILIVK
jgi:ATP-dependent DNA helicase RecG